MKQAFIALTKEVDGKIKTAPKSIKSHNQSIFIAAVIFTATRDANSQESDFV